MDYITAYDRLIKAKYYTATSPKESGGLNLIRSLYDDNCLGCLKANLMDICGEYESTITERDIKIATLEAKVYAYEQIIANSNFKPILNPNSVVSGIVTVPLSK